jgi:hypothetical protein
MRVLCFNTVLVLTPLTLLILTMPATMKPTHLVLHVVVPLGKFSSVTIFALWHIVVSSGCHHGADSLSSFLLLWLFNWWVAVFILMEF